LGFSLASTWWCCKLCTVPSRS